MTYKLAFTKPGPPRVVHSQRLLNTRLHTSVKNLVHIDAYLRIKDSLYNEIRALRIYEGASEIQRLIIARAMTAGWE